MKHGTILRNMWQPSLKSYLVYLGLSGRYAKCLWIINGELVDNFTMHNFYKKDILEDREHFPIVGYVPIEKAVANLVAEGIEDGYCADSVR